MTEGGTGAAGFLPLLIRRLLERGLDLVQPFSVRQINRQLPPEQHLPVLGGDDALGLVIGNSRLLWEPFVSALHADPVPQPDALDNYIERSVRAAIDSTASDSPDEQGLVLARCWVGFAHQLEPRPLPIQKLADHSGLAALGPAHLNVHPLYGPWIALRAVVVCAFEPPAPLANGSPPSAAPCDGCASPCRGALARALDPPPGPESDMGAMPAELNDTQRRFLMVREVCPVGRPHRYSDEQIVYHYARGAPRPR